jgi:hypothetical protein
MSGRGRFLRLAALAAGIALVAWFVHDAGTQSVLAVMDRAIRWLPVIVLLEAVILVTDFWASRALVGGARTRVAPALWLRATTLAYASSILLPAGRAAGEATRAATLSPALGWGHASAVCTRLQAAVLFANAIASTTIALTIATLGPPAARVLPWALLGNALVCALIGTALVLLLRDARFQAWLRRRFPRFVRSHAPEPFTPERAPLGLAVILALFQHVAQTTQYGVVAHAVGGAVSSRVAMAAQGIHLVGAAAGDAVPNQMGATEGAYRLFSSALGMDAPQALSIALVVRVAQLAVALGCLLVGVVASSQRRAAAEPR